MRVGKDMEQGFERRAYGRGDEEAMGQEINGNVKMEGCPRERGGENKEEGLCISRAVKKGEGMREESGETERETLRMEVESRSRNEEFARVAVAVFMSRLDPTMEEIDDVKTAVSEAVTNAVIHGYQGREGIIYIQVTVEGQDLQVEIKDNGVGIGDVEKAMEPMYTTDVTGERSGMGFSFMEAFMDQVQVISAPGRGTCVVMKKHIGR